VDRVGRRVGRGTPTTALHTYIPSGPTTALMHTYVSIGRSSLSYPRTHTTHRSPCRSVRFFEFPPLVDTRSGSVKKPCFISDYIKPPKHYYTPLGGIPTLRGPQMMGGNVAKVVPHEASNCLRMGKLTFDKFGTLSMWPGLSSRARDCFLPFHGVVVLM
jgi:hypothetical protein